MWVLFALLSALFAGVTSILAKCGIRKTDSTVATALRTIVVLLMSFFMVLAMEVPCYIDGVNGFNIEDMVLITEDGCEVLTPNTPHYL